MTAPVLQGPPPGADRGRPDPAVAKVVYQVGLGAGASAKVLLASFEAALVESEMQNLDHGHEDSLGVFQQRPSQGWGDPEQVTNVTYAANQFFARAKDIAAEHPELSPGRVAQAVQRSAYPERYDRRERQARRLIDETRHAVGNGPTPPPPPDQPQPPPLPGTPAGPPQPTPTAENFERAESKLHAEMLRNIDSDDVRRLRNMLRNWSVTDPQEENPYRALGALLTPSGAWDYASKLRDEFPFESRFPIPEAEGGKRLYSDYYVIWANVHFGFCGRAAGFDRVTLLPGSPLYRGAPFPDSVNEKSFGDDNLRGDVIASCTGADLYEWFGGELTREQLRQAVDAVVQRSRGLTPEQSEYRYWDSESYVHGEMVRNVHSPVVDEIRELLAPREWWEVWRMGHFEIALARWGAIVFPHGRWDHKPKLQARFGLESDNDFYFKIPGDGANRSLSYDVWSNIHYGYVGRAAGFARPVLLGGAHQGAAGQSDPGDDVTMNLGMTLWEKYGEHLTKDDLHREVLGAIDELAALPEQPTQLRVWKPAPS